MVFGATQRALQCWNNVVTIRSNAETMLQHCVTLKIVGVSRPVDSHLNARTKPNTYIMLVLAVWSKFSNCTCFYLFAHLLIYHGRQVTVRYIAKDVCNIRSCVQTWTHLVKLNRRESLKKLLTLMN